jgi:CheY-like chemotaxis protein
MPWHGMPVATSPVMSIPAPAPSSLRKSILVVDDDDEMRAALTALLSCTYGVTVAVDGIDGCEKAIERQPDLIIADVRMPRLDGVAMIRRIRESESLRSVPVIFLTGQMSAQQVTEGLSVAPFAYLPKPTDPCLLQKRVQRALGGD